MDTEEGVEVVWNEATFSEAKKFKAQEDKLRSVFEILTLIDHPNIVKFHKYWTDEGRADDKAKAGEYMNILQRTDATCCRRLRSPGSS